MYIEDLLIINHDDCVKNLGGLSDWYVFHPNDSTHESVQLNHISTRAVNRLIKYLY